MNLRDLEYVEAIGRFASFSRAACACNVSQPALSNQVKKLEQELGAELFYRRMQEVRPTELGQRVIEAARSVLDETRKIRDMATEYRDPTAVPLRVGVTPTLAPYLTPYLSSQIRRLVPDLRVSLVEDRTERLAEMVTERDIDIALVPQTAFSNRLDFTPLFDEPMFLAVHPDHPLAERDADTEIGCNDIPLDELVCSRSPLGYEAEADPDRMASIANGNHDLDITAASFETVCRHVCLSGGCTIVPALAAEQFKRDGWSLTFVRINANCHIRHIGVISRCGCPRKPLLATICEEVYANLPSGVEPASERQA